MRQLWTRNGSAALLFAIFGVAVAILAVMSRSEVLAAVAGVALISAVTATRGFPIDRNW
jgi:predicted benzoate:H+ symporter BenE